MEKACTAGETTHDLSCVLIRTGYAIVVLRGYGKCEKRDGIRNTKQ